MGEIAHMLQFRHTSNCFDEQESKYFAKHKNCGVVTWSSWANLTACYHWKGRFHSPYFLPLPSHPRLVFCWVSKFNCLTKWLGKRASQCKDRDKSMWLKRMLLASHYIDPVIQLNCSFCFHYYQNSPFLKLNLTDLQSLSKNPPGPMLL